MAPEDDTATNDTWLSSLRLELASTPLDRRQADEAVAGCAEQLRQSGEQGRDLFGPPEAHAAELGRTLASETSLGADATQAGDEWVDVVTLVGVSLVVAAVLLGNEHGLTTPLTVAGAAGTACLAGLLALAGVAVQLRQAGRFGWFRLGVGLIVVGILGAALALTSLPGQTIASLPTLLIGGIGAGVVLASWKLSQRTARKHAQTATTAPASDHDLSTELSAETLDDASWLRRLSGLLRGRYDWTSAHTARAVREAQAHLVRTGRSAPQEYGSVEAYASDLVDRVPWRRGRFHRQVRMAAARTALHLRRDLGSVGGQR